MIRINETVFKIRPIEPKHRHLWGKKVFVTRINKSKTDYPAYNGTIMLDVAEIETGKGIFEVLYIYEVEEVEPVRTQYQPCSGLVAITA